MMKKKLPICLFTMLALGGGAAIAGETSTSQEPVQLSVQLSDSQMDRVSAGQQSWAFGSASALYGTVRSTSRSSAISAGPLRYTSASNSSYAFGFGTSANAEAGSSF